MLRVAVVEDETEYRGLIQEMVGRYAKEYDLQIQTTAFPDGRELVQNYHKFDILLMDIEMPRMDGREVLTEIRDDAQFTSIPVVILTSSNAPEDREIGDALHVEDYLIKPVAVEPFLELVKRLKRFWHSDLVLPALD